MGEDVREIKEGDILHLDHFSDWVVIWGKARFEIYNVCDPDRTFPLEQTFVREVIGNIYENPDMAKTPEKVQGGE